MNTVYVGKLGKAVGLKGHVKLFIESDFPEQFKKGATFTTSKNQTLVIEEFNASRGVVKFETVNDMDAAKRLTNSQLFTSLEQTKESCQLKENQYFWFDIIDCELIENEEVLGKVKDIYRYPVDDYLEITTNVSFVEKGLPKIFLVPYIDEYVISVDVENKRIVSKGAMAILENS